MSKRAIAISLMLALPTAACDDNDTPAKSDTTQAPDTTSGADSANEDDSSTGDAASSEDAATEDSSSSEDASAGDASEADAGPDTATGEDATEPVEDASEDAGADVSDVSDEDVSGAEVDTTETPVTWAEVHPIFKASCGGCHGGSTPTGGSGGHAIGSADAANAYLAAMLDADGYPACDGLNIAECSLLRIQDGSMPKGGGAPPGVDAQELIQQWLDDGMLE